MRNVAILAFAGAICACTMALVAPWRQRLSMILVHWAFAAGMVVLALESFFAGMSACSSQPEAIIHWQSLKLIALSFLPGIWLFFSLGYSRGHLQEFLRKWRIVLAAAFLAPVGVALCCRNNLIVVRPASDAQPALGLGLPGIILHLLLLITTLMVLMNLERTFRASVGTMRWRIKFMIMGLGMLFAVRLYTSSQALLFPGVNLSLDALNSAALLVACLLILRSLLRAGHFDVSVYPSHSVLHNSLTILLAGVYLLIVGLFARVVTYLGGDAAFTLKAFVVLVALVVLAILLLSDQVRMHTKRFVSRHFQRPMYDYRTVWRSLTEGMASRIDQMDLCRATVNLVADIFQVLSVTIWLVEDTRENLNFIASSSLFEGNDEKLRLPGADVKEMLRALQKRPEPFDIESSKESWAAALRRCHPDQFHKGGGRVCVPVVVGGEVLGLMVLGDRVGGVPFSQQDLDLLKCVGDQVAAGLRNVVLSQKLLQARELEAFQAMSAFFVHDLKNTASTLGLMLQNLPVHFNDPTFREDALRGVSKTVAHINQLIARLSLLRHGLEIRPAASDLNELVSKALSDWQDVSEVELVRDFRPVPKVPFDREQMLKVVINLVLNAKEAVSPKGRISIETGQNNGWVVLAIKDTGCGMSAEFLKRSLFRPFQTTKKNGFGIGMFQSKMIVEAHKGRIEVESELGKGTTFRVLLPLST